MYQTEQGQAIHSKLATATVNLLEDKQGRVLLARCMRHLRKYGKRGREDAYTLRNQAVVFACLSTS